VTGGVADGRPVTFCLPPRKGEICVPVRFELRRASVTLQLTSRHRVVGLEVDDDLVLVDIEIAEPATSRPVDVRFDTVPAGAGPDTPYSTLVGKTELRGDPVEVWGTYLGPVADES
jgi:hypothetical protein